MRGRFITFEGGEGAGKSTQVKLLKADLESRGIEVVLTREPGGTPLSERIRTLLKDYEEDAPNARAEVLLFLAARAQLVESVIEPALAAGKWVISDRFSDSTLAYQGYGRGLDIGLLREMNDFACTSLKPDLTILMDLEPEVASSRMRGRESATGTSADRIERAGADFHRRLRDGFLRLAAAEPSRLKLVDASRPVEDIHSAVRRLVFSV